MSRRRFAKLGYIAIAPEMFARQGDVSKMTDIGEILSKVVAKVPDEQVFADVQSTFSCFLRLQWGWWHHYRGKYYPNLRFHSMTTLWLS